MVSNGLTNACIHWHVMHMMMLRVANLKQGLRHLSSGVTEEEAKTLWATFDRNSDGVMDESEVSALP